MQRSKDKKNNNCNKDVSSARECGDAMSYGDRRREIAARLVARGGGGRVFRFFFLFAKQHEYSVRSQDLTMQIQILTLQSR